MHNSRRCFLAFLCHAVLNILPYIQSSVAWRHDLDGGVSGSLQAAQSSATTAPPLFFDASLVSTATALEASKYEDLPPIVFGPQGRLFSVEAALRASQMIVPRSNVALAMKCRDGLVLLTTIPTSAFLNTTGIVMPVHNEITGGGAGRSLFLSDETCRSTTTAPTVVTPTVVAATAGNAIHGRLLRQHIRALMIATLQQEDDVLDAANDDKEDDGSYGQVLARHLGQDISNGFQQATQTMQPEHLPLLACSALLLGQNEIWRVDPTGQFWQCQATCIGQDAHALEDRLYQLVVQDMHGTDNPPRPTGNDAPSSPPSPVAVQDHLDSLRSEQALSLLQKCLTAHLHERYRKERRFFPSSVDDSSTKAIAVPQVFWQAVTMDYGSLKKNGEARLRQSLMTPNTTVQQGSFRLLPDEAAEAREQ